MATRTVEMVGEHKLEQVFLTVEDHIGILTLHNPPVNAASGTVQEEIIMLCDYINHDDDIWVCIMHSDLKTFCVGVDIKRFKKALMTRTLPIRRRYITTVRSRCTSCACR